MSKSTGVVNIRGKEYKTVALRVSEFREQHPTFRLITSIVHRDEESVVMEARVLNEVGELIANGHAEESRTSSQINKTSALENCETSAVGRALASFGLGGSEYASANEVQNAIHQQEQRAEVVEDLDIEIAQELITAMKVDDHQALQFWKKNNPVQFGLAMNHWRSRARVKKSFDDKVKELLAVEPDEQAQA